ncbi:MAG: 6,7-dimethyl-8-ribityllumazine synthase [Gemmatimonadota bacterium]
MPTEREGRLVAVGRIAIVVSRYHERLTSRLLEGAQAACTDAGTAPDAVDILWVSGAFELGVTATAAARSGDYAAVVALGIVVRGETPHFDFVAGETSAALRAAASETLVPVVCGAVMPVDGCFVQPVHVHTGFFFQCLVSGC